MWWGGVVGMFVPLGCKSDDPITPANVADKFASAYCAAAAHCCQAEGTVADPSLCMQYGQTVVATSQYEISGASTFNADIAAECIKAAGAFDCWDRSSIEAVCRFIYTGVVPIGGNCLSDEDCAQTPTRAACGAGSKCVADSFLGQAGASCLGRAVDCDLPQGLACVEDPQNSAVESCQPRSDIGGPCTYQPDCQDGLYCDKSIPTMGKCAPIKPAGAACTGLDCDWHAECLNGVCTPAFLSEAVCVAPSGTSDAGAMDAGGCSKGMVWCSCTSSYAACGPDGSTADACQCPGTVVVGGDAGATLPDPGVIVVEAVSPSDLAADPRRNEVYVASMGQRVVRALSTVTGATLWVAPSPGFLQPARLAVSDDGSKVYAADNSNGWIERVIGTTGAADITITLPPDPTTGEVMTITDIAVVPGAPQTLVVVVGLGSQEKVMVYDDDVPRAATAQVKSSSLIVFGDATTLYALAGDGSLETLTLSSDGIHSGSAAPTPNLFTQSRQEFLFDGQLAFADDGHVVDLKQGVLLGSYGVAGPVAVDPTGNRSYIVLPASAGTDFIPLALGEFDRTAFTRLRTLTLSVRGTRNLLVRAADGTLATDGSLEAPKSEGVVLIRPDAWQAATSP
jgi:hypothetical protein